MLRTIALLGAMFCALGSTNAAAFSVSHNDYGGRVEKYRNRLASANAHDEEIRIGNVTCVSSCTLFLNARHGCVSSRATLGFHAPWYGTESEGVVDPRMTAYFARSYKPALRRVFLAHVRETGWQAPGPILTISGRQLAHMGYQLCQE